MTHDDDGEGDASGDTGASELVRCAEILVV